MSRLSSTPPLIFFIQNLLPCKNFCIFAENLYDMENWRLIDENSKYEVNNEGQVRNVKTGRLLKPFLSHNGYLKVSLGGKNRMIHRLVALAFLPNPNNYPFINHKDEDKENNSVENLEWCTAKYNINYGKRTSRFIETINTKRKIRPYLYRPVLQYSLDGKFIQEFPSIKAAAQAINAKNDSGIGLCCRGKYRYAMGYIWRYKNEAR